MNKSIIYIKNNSIIYNNTEYESGELKTNKKLYDKRILFILEQDLYIKKMDFHKNQSVNNLIMSEFGENEDYLFDYKMSKDKKQIVVYAIKGGNTVLLLCDGAKAVKVIPIQIYITNSIKKLIKDKIWNAISKFKGSYYFIAYKDKYIKCSYVEKNIDNLIERIKENNYLEDLYVDINIKCEKLQNIDIKNISLGEILNEKRTWKQRFFTL